MVDIDSRLFETAAYDFDLPEGLIAQKPVSPRDHSRLLVLDRRKGRIEHRHFYDLPEYLDAQDRLVANNTKVIPARLLGHRIKEDGSQGGKVEFLLLEPMDSERRVWTGLIHVSAKSAPGLKFSFEGGLAGELTRGTDSAGTVEARFNQDPVKWGRGDIPLPPYIRKGLAVPRDRETYQTIYAKEEGSAAAPTAGFHFTDELKAKLVNQGSLGPSLHSTWEWGPFDR